MLIVSLFAGIAPATAGQVPIPPALRPAFCAHVPPPSQSLPGAISFTYRTLGDRTLRIHVFQPDGRRRDVPAALFFFGGGFRVGDASSFAPLAKAFVAHGYVSILADYRVLCRDGVTAIAGVDDAEHAFAWTRVHAREFGIDRRRIVLVGGSAGGLLAASTGLRASDRNATAALVLFNPVIALETGLTQHDQTIEEARPFSASLLPIDRLPPTIIYHGTADKTVPIQTSRDFCVRAIAAGRSCQLVEYQGMDHSFADRHEKLAFLGASMFDDTLRRTFLFLDPMLGSNTPDQATSR